MLWKFPKIRGTLFGGPYNKDPTTPPGRKFRHAAYNIDMCRGEAKSPKTRFTWPAWRSNYFPGINLYYYIVPGGELCGVVLGVYGGKGVNMW